MNRIEAHYTLAKHVFDIRQDFAKRGEVDKFKKMQGISCADIFSTVEEAYAAWGDRSDPFPLQSAGEMVHALIQIKLEEETD